VPDVATAVEDARALVALWFADARAAWLGGSVVLGQDTPGSDLDVTVLLEGPPAPFRDSRRYRGWPVELFVHTETSLDFYARRDASSGRPTMTRLLGCSQVLLDTDGSGLQWQATARALLSAGPPRLAGDELASLRYAVTDAMDDVTHAHDAHERLVTATMLADEAAHLLLHGARHWWGRGKWVARELADLDARDGTDWRPRHEQALVTAAAGDVSLLLAFADDVLAQHGGPLFEGHRLAGTDPATASGTDQDALHRGSGQSGKSPSATRTAGPASSTR
jgi:hypothetical protein